MKIEQNFSVKHNKNYIEKILNHIFFLLFVANILSPYFLDRTIYLEILIIIFNPFYWKWIKKNKIGMSHMLFVLSFIFNIVLGHIETSLKIFLIMLEVSYMFYAVDKKMNFLNIYVVVSIFFAIFQFIFIFIDASIAYNIGPSNIASFIWGNYATPTYTNFYTIFLVPRVSGLSREAGFLASLINCILIYKYLQKKREFIKTNTLEILILWMGYIVSFSKMSIVLLFVYTIECFGRYLKKIPAHIMIIIFFLFMVFFSYQNVQYLLLDENITFLHRFGAYASMLNLDLYQVIFGINLVSEVDGTIATTLSYSYEFFAGPGGFVVKNGIIVTVVYFLVLYFYGVTSTGFLVLFLLSFNVQLDTNQNFMVVAYFLVFKYFRRCKIS